MKSIHERMNRRKTTQFVAVIALLLLFSLFSLPTQAQHHPVTDSVIVKLSSTLWSDLRDIKFQQSQAYSVFLDGLTVTDLSNINSPSQIGQVELPGAVLKAHISDSLAVAICADSSLHVIGISTVSDPALMDNFKLPDMPADVRVRDNCAYVAAKEAGLLVLDVADPFNVSLIGSCYVADFSPLSLDLLGNVAYLAGIGGLRLISIVFPYVPYLIGSSDVVPGANKVFANSKEETKYAYLGNPAQLSILDVTNPDNIFPLSSYPTSFTIADISVSGDHVYLVLAYKELKVLDVRDRTSPTEVSALRLGDYTTGVFFYSDFAFVTDIFDPTAIINVFNPDRPFSSGDWVMPGPCKDLAVRDSFAYVMCDHSGLHLLNLSDPTDPQLVSTLYAPYNNNGVDVEGNYVYITALLTGIQVVDVSDPSHPEVVDRYQPEGYTYGVVTNEEHAYLLNAQNDIQIIDIQDPTALIPRGSVDTPGALKDILIRGDYLYAADGGTGVTIINVSDKDDPFVVKSVPTAGECTNVFSSGNLLFTACDEVGMETYDITDPETPLFQSVYSGSEEIKYLYVEGQYAYLSMKNHKLEVIDISSSPPAFITSYDLLDNPGRLVVKDQHIYLCDYRSFKTLKFLPPSRSPKPSARKM